MISACCSRFHDNSSSIHAHQEYLSTVGGCISALHSKLYTFRTENFYSDTIVRVEDRIFRCHRLVLASAFEYFDTEFRLRGPLSDITLPSAEVSADVFAKLLDAAYTGHPPKVDAEHVSFFLSVCVFLGAHEFEVACLRFIEREFPRFDVHQTLELIYWALDNRRWSLVKDICAHIALNFKYSLLLHTGNLDCVPYKLLRLVIAEYRYTCPSITDDEKSFPRFRDEHILDTVIRWTLLRDPEQARFFDWLSAPIDFARVSTEYVKTLPQKYGMLVRTEGANRSWLRQTVFDFLSDPARSPSSAHELCSVAEDAESTLPLMHVVLKYGEGARDLGRIYTWNECHCSWFLRRADMSDWSTLRMAGCGPPEARRLYCYGFERQKQDFRWYRSVSGLSMGKDGTLTCPPCKSKYFDVCCGTRHRDELCWYNRDAHQNSHYKGLSKKTEDKFDGGTKEIERGIYLYSCERDVWRSPPEPKVKVSHGSVTADDDLLYLIGGHKRVGYPLNGRFAQAYDQRCAEWFRLPETVNTYRDGGCCTLNGEVYVADAEVVERYDRVAGRWQEICTVFSEFYLSANRRPMERGCEKRMVPYKDLLWLYTSDGERLETNIIDPYEPNDGQRWRVSSMLNESVVLEIGDIESLSREWALEESDVDDPFKDIHLLDAVVFAH